MTTRQRGVRRRAALLFMVLGSLGSACGKTSDDASTDSATGGNGGNGGGPLSTGNIGSTTSVGGNGGGSTTGSGGFGNGGFGNTGGSSGSGAGGSGGDLNCAPDEHLLEGCYSIAGGAAGQGGLAGAAGASGSDPCWDEDAPDECEASFEGEVRQVMRGADATWCDGTLFELTDLSVDGRQGVIIGAGDVTLAVVLGRPSGELDVEVGDTVRAELRRSYFYFGFMHGSRLTLTKNGEFLAVLNDDFPPEEPIQYGDLTLSWGEKLCERPYDGACTFSAHELDVVLDDEGLSVAPYSSARIGPYEILTEAIFSAAGAGFCDAGDHSEYLIARVKP